MKNRLKSIEKDVGRSWTFGTVWHAQEKYQEISFLLINAWSITLIEEIG